MNVTVDAADYSASTYYRSKHKTLPQDTTDTAEIWFENVGNMPWYDDIGEHTGPEGTVRTVLYTSNPYGVSSPLGELWGPRQNRPTAVFKAVYESDGITLAADQHITQPGEIAAFEFTYTVPADLPLDKYKTWLQPVLKGDRNAFSPPDGAFMNVIVE
jgi:hypothetical protein